MDNQQKQPTPRKRANGSTQQGQRRSSGQPRRATASHGESVGRQRDTSNQHRAGASQRRSAASRRAGNTPQRRPSSQQPRPAQQQSAGGGWKTLILFIVGIAVLVVIMFNMITCVGCLKPPKSSIDFETNDPTVASSLIGHGDVTKTGDGVIHFCAVGDNLMNQNLLDLADAAAGETNDNKYDFTSFYTNVKDEIAKNDLAFINQETVLGGDTFLNYQGYPSYNTPDEAAAAIADTGWNMVNCNSNHTYDDGHDAILHEIKVWEQYPDILTAGMYSTEKDAATIHMIERNGIKVAFLSYNYGLNGYENSQVEDGSLVNFYNKDRLETDITNANKVADAVIVSMHWGDEYTHQENETQRTWAQTCADLGATAVIGTHTHFIQPVSWVEGKNGNQTLVAYCLGDFVSGYQWIDTIVGGMLTFDLVAEKDEEGDDYTENEDGAIPGRTVTVRNVKWTPTVEHLSNGTYSVYFLKDYTDELAQQNELFSSANHHNTQEILDDPIAYIKQMTTDTITGIDVDMGTT